jgi:hypothetical protein
VLKPIDKCYLKKIIIQTSTMDHQDSQDIDKAKYFNKTLECSGMYKDFQALEKKGRK